MTVDYDAEVIAREFSAWAAWLPRRGPLLERGAAGVAAGARSGGTDDLGAGGERRN